MSAQPLPSEFDIPASQLRLRAMRPDDVPVVAEIDIRAYEFPWTQGIFSDCLRAGYHCMVLEEDAVLVGYAIFAVAAHEAHLLNICVVPELQGRGCGRRLVRRVLDLARWQRCERIFLEVRPSNRRAIALYDSLGFNEIAARPRYYPAHNGAREDALVLALELLAPE